MFMHNASDFHVAEKISADTIALARMGLACGVNIGGPGLLAGSLVETAAGWRPVETLWPGVEVATYDGGFCPLARVERRKLWPASMCDVVRVPGGALDNCSDFSLLPDQHVLLTSEIAQEVLDTPGALIPAAALVGYRGISRQQILQPVDVLTLRFASEEIVYVNSGTLIHCAAEGLEAEEAVIGAGYFEMLKGSRAQAMLALMAAGVMSTASLQHAA